MSNVGGETSLATNGERGISATYALSDDLVTLSEGRKSEAEAVRTIRTHVMNQHMKNGRRGISVCGATPGVGCTFTAVNLAVSLSQAGVSTLLIDANMRQPQIGDFIRPQKATSGLAQCLADPDHLASDYIQPEVLPNLSVMFAGGVAHDAQELLAGEPFQRLVERCLRDFEFTILDTPPASVCADARRIASVVGYALIVARANVTHANQLSQLASRLGEDGARVIGTVLNDI